MLPAPTRDDIEVGLKYINNDACYPDYRCWSAHV